MKEILKRTNADGSKDYHVVEYDTEKKMSVGYVVTRDARGALVGKREQAFDDVAGRAPYHTHGR